MSIWRQKKNRIPNADQFTNTLVLLKKGDVWDGNLITMVGQNNFKIGYFGNDEENRPRITGDWFHASSYQNFGQLENPSTSKPWTYATDVDATQYGWPIENTVDGIKLGGVSFGMSFKHATIHDVDIDQEMEKSGGFITWSRGHLFCYDFPSKLRCSNVPFPKGVYVSKTRVISGYGSLNSHDKVEERKPSATLNVGSIGCGMVNWAGITDSYFQRAYEHNLRVMGWYRFSIMRNVWAGEHYKNSKQKISTRVCAGGPDWANWNKWAPTNWDQDPEGRTREDSNRRNGLGKFNSGDYVHTSRYQVIESNIIGVKGRRGTQAEGPNYQPNIPRTS